MNETKIREQIRLQEEIQSKANINIVDCGHCGSTFLHKRHLEEIECPFCERVMDQSDCPDLFFNGMSI